MEMKPKPMPGLSEPPAQMVDEVKPVVRPKRKRRPPQFTTDDAASALSMGKE